MFKHLRNRKSCRCCCCREPENLLRELRVEYVTKEIEWTGDNLSEIVATAEHAFDVQRIEFARDREITLVCRRRAYDNCPEREVRFRLESGDILNVNGPVARYPD